MNTPNKLTIFRILLIPLIVLIEIFPYAQFQINMPTYLFNGVFLSLKNIIVLVIFIIASFTDFLDGYLARKNQQITTFGKFLDPIADKLLVNSLLIILAYQGAVPLVAVLLMIWRDTVVDGIRMMSSSKGVVVSAGILGKIKTVSQMVTIVLVLLNNMPFAFIGLPVTDFLIWFSTLVSLVSGYSYFQSAKEIILETM
ncbi:MAG: CDP-diacylglycerol--glycerol-3-phosphate 3-phosphatidyltransferase [Erysipelothrix sp.]|nr:CDP-diacylglycerol--glycerol-3-phosphate 3-phosphatidyltransferase [Erysipelothrix sp.]